MRNCDSSNTRGATAVDRAREAGVAGLCASRGYWSRTIAAHEPDGQTIASKSSANALTNRRTSGIAWSW